MTVVVDARQELARQGATRTTRSKLKVREFRASSTMMVNLGQPGGRVRWLDLAESPVLGHD